MDQRSQRQDGPLFQFFAGDHRRLDGILRRAVANGETVDLALFEEFRGGLLRHIGMEEKVLIPAARRARGGEPLPVARLLRLDHGAIAALLVPTPTVALSERIRSVLGPHNALEEEPDGLYETCDRLLSAEAPALLETLRSFPPVPLAPHQDGPLVERHIAETLALAREAKSNPPPKP
jgi:hemerythrin HHE cation binding domain-containing protein